MRAVDPSSTTVDTEQVWWWQLPDDATPAEVRHACSRNALSAIASASDVKLVRAAVAKVIAAFNWTYEREGRRVRSTRGDMRIQVILDWAQIHADREVQAAVDRLWQSVLLHHREAWDAETRRILERRNDPGSPVQGLRRRWSWNAATPT